MCLLQNLKCAAMADQIPSVETKGAAVLRKGSQSKMALKEKIVQIYEAFFRVRN